MYKRQSEERAYIADFRKVIGDEAADRDLGMLPEFDLETRHALCKRHPMGDFILPFEPQDVVETASSDMGDVSQIAPLLQLQCACFCLGTQPHSWVEVAQGKSSYAVKGMLFAAETLYRAAVKLMEDPQLVKKAKEENARRTGGRAYRLSLIHILRRISRMAGQPVKLKICLAVGQHGAAHGGIDGAGMPGQCRIQFIKNAGSGHDGLSAAALLRRAAVYNPVSYTHLRGPPPTP